MSVKSANETEGHLLSTRDLDLFSSDEWQKFTDETIEIRKMVHTYREKVLETPDDDIELLTAELIFSSLAADSRSSSNSLISVSSRLASRVWARVVGEIRQCHLDRARADAQSQPRLS